MQFCDQLEMHSPHLLRFGSRYDEKKRVVIPNALKCLRLKNHRKFARLGDLSPALFWHLLAWRHGRHRARNSRCHSRHCSPPCVPLWAPRRTDLFSRRVGNLSFFTGPTAVLSPGPFLLKSDAPRVNLSCIDHGKKCCPTFACRRKSEQHFLCDFGLAGYFLCNHVLSRLAQDDWTL